jgi:ketosteroid isomerase-like protein
MTETITDHDAIQRLIARYSDAVNTRQFDVLPTLFTPDASWEVVMTGATIRFEGPAGIGAGIGGLVGNFAFIVQFVTLPVIEVDGEKATSRCMLMEVGDQPANGVRIWNFGLYEDELRKVSGKWIFKSRRFTMKSPSNMPLPG